MVQIATTNARLISPDWANRVPSPAYDAMTPQQRRARRLANPWSFLNVTLSPEDVADDEQVSNEQLLALARESLNRILATDAFPASAQAAVYLYRLRSDSHEQTGLVADIAIADYINGDVRIHEKVREKRAQLLGDHMYQLGVSSSPIALTYQNTTSLSQLIDSCSNHSPTLTIPPTYGVEQTIWRITDSATIAAFQAALSDRTLYIIDGHHRAAASLAVHQKAPSVQSERIFGVMFPHDALKLSGFNRWIRQATQPHLQSLKQMIRLRAAICTDLYRAPGSGEIAIYLEKKWWLLPLQGDDFDSQKLFDQILAPCFGLALPDDANIVNVPQSIDIAELQQSVDRAGSVGFALAPLTIEQFMQAADRQLVLPPKSTYFVPKAQSGVFLRSVHDDA